MGAMDAARNLLRGEGYSPVVAGQRYPPPYPAGFPLLVVPALALLGDAPGTGIVVVAIAAAVAIAATAGLAGCAGGTASAVAAAWMLALAPLHVCWPRAVMSDAPASAAAALLDLGTLRALRGRRPGLRSASAPASRRLSGRRSPSRWASCSGPRPARSSRWRAAARR